MDVFLIVTGSLLMILGVAGCLLPVLPGPPLAYLGLIALHLTTRIEFTAKFLIWWGVITIITAILDYVIPIWGTRLFGGSKYGIWGSMAGLVAGLFFPPFGLIIGPFLGAVAGEMAAGNRDNALKAGFGSFLGFFAGTIVKFVVAFIMLWYFISALI